MTPGGVARTRDLERRLSEAEATIQALLSGQIDAVVDSTNRTPILLAKAQEALRRGEERMRFALESASVGIYDMDYTTGELRWSTTLEAQHGLEPGTFGGTFDSFTARVHPEDRQSLLDTVGAAMKAGADFTESHRALWPDGTVRWLSGAGRIYLGEHGEPVRGLGISRDVTESRALEEHYQQASKMEAVGRLASGVAHDFNNLLTVILGCADLMATDSTMASRHTEDLDEIIKAARRAAGLTKQLLAFGRQQVMHATALNVNALITDMTGMLDRLIGEHVDVALDLAPNLSLALVDRSQLEQVIMNLVVNARDAMSAGGAVTIRTRDVDLESSSVDEAVIVPGPYVMLAVTDHGSGMSKETKARLFEPFFTTKEPGKGTGLGLSTTFGIVKQSKGYIWVDSEPGRGTTLRVYLPCSNRTVPAPAPSPVFPPAKSEPTILLVEDEAGVRRFAKSVLETAGYVVLEAPNGDAAERLFALRGEQIDLVVSDVVMPGCSGPELAGRLRLLAPGLRVLFMSGNVDHSGVRKTGIGRDVPFIQKPFTPAELVQQVRAALAEATSHVVLTV